MARKRSRVAEAICKNCGYGWYPDATRWRNHNASNNAKVVFCPACNSRNRLTYEKLKEILQRAVFVKRLRVLGKA